MVAYDRSDTGTLTGGHAYSTGGRGGVLNGSVVDHLASQGSLAYDDGHGLLYAVNAGSDSVSTFAVTGDQLSLRQVTGSGGSFPVSIAVHDDLVYVLNAEQGGSVQGYLSLFGRLIPLPWAHRSLGLTIPTGVTQFTSTPGQVAFSPDGSKLIVTTKGSGNSIDVFKVGFLGLLSAPTVNAEPGAVPFAVTFDPAGHLVVAEAGPNAVSTFTLEPTGAVTPVDTVATNQIATCWVASAGSLVYAANAGSGSETGLRTTPGGQLSLLGNTSTDPGSVDGATSPDQRFLYVQTGAHGVVERVPDPG